MEQAERQWKGEPFSYAQEQLTATLLSHVEGTGSGSAQSKNIRQQPMSLRVTTHRLVPLPMVFRRLRVCRQHRTFSVHGAGGARKPYPARIGLPAEVSPAVGRVKTEDGRARSPNIYPHKLLRLTGCTHCVVRAFIYVSCRVPVRLGGASWARHPVLAAFARATGGSGRQQWLRMSR